MLVRPPLHSDEAIYQNLAGKLEEEIARWYEPGQFLPPERVLAERFGVSRHAVRRAIEELIGQGIAERLRGRGTRIIDPAIRFPIGSRTRFTEALEEQGRAATNVVIFSKEVDATAGVAKELAISEKHPVIWIETLRMVGDEPFSLASIFLPTPRFSGVLTGYSGGSLHSYLEEHHQVAPLRDRSIITAAKPSHDDARLLRIPHSRPILQSASVNVDPADKRPVEFCITRARSDRAQIEIRP